MNNETFMQQSWDFLAETMDMAEKKGVEYANGGDRLGNFKRAAKELGVDPKMVATIYLKKHLDSIMQYVRTNNRESLTEAFSGRVADAIVYLLIILAIDREQEEVAAIEDALQIASDDHEEIDPDGDDEITRSAMSVLENRLEDLGRANESGRHMIRVNGRVYVESA